MLQLLSPSVAPGRPHDHLCPFPEASFLSERKPGILVVEDEPLVRELLQRGLKSHGFQVWTAADAWQALALYGELREELAVVLLDVTMPGMDGPTALRVLQWRYGDVPACFMTGYTSRYTREDLLNSGGLHVFDKPFRLDEVAEVLRQVAGRDAVALARSVGLSTWTEEKAPRPPAWGSTRKDSLPWTVSREQLL